MDRFLLKFLPKFTLKLLSLIFLYSYFISFFFAYKGDHWDNLITHSERNLLNISVFLITLILVILIYFINDRIFRNNIVLDNVSIRWIILAAFLLRVSWVLFSSNSQMSDFLEYDEMAKNISNGESILEYISSSRNVGAGVFFGFIYYLFGYNQDIPLIFNAVLSTLQLFFVYRIIIKINGKNTALISCLILALFPEHILLNNLFSTDILFSTLICLSIYIFSNLNQETSKYNSLLLIFAGVSLGLAHWTRSTAPIFLISSIIYFLLFSKETLRLRFLRNLFLTIGFFLVISPIIHYNYSNSSKFDIKPIHGQMGTSLLIGTFYNGDGRFKTWNKKEDHEFLSKSLEEYKNAGFDNSPHNIKSLKDKVYSKIAIDRINENPFSFLKLILKHKMTNLWGIVAGLSFSIDNSSVNKYKSYIWGFSEIFHRVIIFLCSISMILLIVIKRNIIDIRFIFVIAAILTSISHIFLESHPRYHHMFLPMFVMFVSELPYLIFQKNKKK